MGRQAAACHGEEGRLEGAIASLAHRDRPYSSLPGSTRHRGGTGEGLGGATTCIPFSAVTEFGHRPNREANPQPWQAPQDLSVRVPFERFVQARIRSLDLLVEQLDRVNEVERLVARRVGHVGGGLEGRGAESLRQVGRRDGANAVSTKQPLQTRPATSPSGFRVGVGAQEVEEERIMHVPVQGQDRREVAVQDLAELVVQARPVCDHARAGSIPDADLLGEIGVSREGFESVAIGAGGIGKHDGVEPVVLGAGGVYADPDSDRPAAG
jgi:hypothetical protein